MYWKHVARHNYRQLIFVFAAFLMMTLVSYYSQRSAMRRHITESANGAMRIAESNIRASLREPELLLINASSVIRNMASSNATREDYARFFNDMADWFLDDVQKWQVFRGIYGVIYGDFIDGTRWEPPNGYVFSTRPWYVAARDKKGATAITMPYLDARPTGAGEQKRLVIGMSREVYGTGLDYIGTIAIDIYLDQFSKNVSALSVIEGGYGMVVNQEFNIIAHKDASLINTPITKLSKEYEGIADTLKSGDNVVAGRTVIDSDGAKWMIFFRKIYNGWYIGMAVPLNIFYERLNRAAWHMTYLGVTLFAVLSCILLRLSAGKLRSDEENKSKTNFLARMSHEIRTPMNAIIGMSELALRTENRRQITDYITNIRQSGLNLLTIINDILDFAKIESGRVNIFPEPYRLSSMLNDVVNVARLRLMDKPVVFAVNIDSHIPDNLVGDSARIRQILTNLLSNAAKYTLKGHVSLTVTGLIMENYDIILKFEISDSGIGIKKQDLNGLFGQYVRLDDAQNKDVEGTGLGLAISKTICNEMGGEISVSSEYGKGSVFTVIVPQSFIKDENLALVNDAEMKSVIFYDERPVYGESVVATLLNLGVPTTVASDAGEFLRGYSSGAYRYAFVSPGIAEEVVSFKKHKNLDTDIVLLSGAGSIPSIKGVSVIQMPAFAVSVANVLNGAPEIKFERKRSVFTSPSAAILVVDDNLTNLKVTHGLLSQYGAHIDLCDSGEKAIARAKAASYDIIFMDHMMPGMDGVETTAAIRAIDACRDTPIIALTANAVSGMREMFLKNGMNDFISKPIEPSQLESLLRRWIPADKQQFAGETSSGGVASEIAGIDGMDVEKVLNNLGGNKEMLCQVLRTFVTHTTYLTDKIMSPTAENLPEYAITVHGIKGSSYSLCADEAASRAEELENAAKAGDLAGVISGNDSFVQALKQLVADIETFLENELDGSEKEVLPSPDAAEMENIIKACRVYDASSIEKSLTNLERYIYERDGDLVRWIREQFENLEYDVIIEELNRRIGRTE